MGLRPSRERSLWGRFASWRRMTKMKKSGAPADGAPSDGASMKKTGASQKPKRSDTSRMMLWAAPVVVLLPRSVESLLSGREQHRSAQACCPKRCKPRCVQH